jgi:sulfur carrier protein ThiS
VNIGVKLYFHLQKYSPSGESAFEMELPRGSTPANVLAGLGLPEEVPKVILVNGRPAGLHTPLSLGDSLVIFPPLEGG